MLGGQLGSLWAKHEYQKALPLRATHVNTPHTISLREKLSHVIDEYEHLTYACDRHTVGVANST